MKSLLTLPLLTSWRWDFVISNTWHRCEKATGNGILGEGGHYAEMLVPAIRYKEINFIWEILNHRGIRNGKVAVPEIV